MPVSHVAEADFQAAVVDADGPVLVDFWAEWCGPCKRIAPILDELSDELSGKVHIVKLNVDENPHIMTNYGIRSIPTMIMFQDGAPAATKIGATSKNELKTWIEDNI